MNSETKTDRQPENDSDVARIEVDNSKAVLESMLTLYNEKAFSDICLIVGGKTYSTHKLVLCSSSEVFRVMLLDPQWSESHKSTIFLGETPACCAVFDHFLKYLYTGRIFLDTQSVLSILTLADKYNIKHLVQVCQDYMLQHIPYAAVNNELVTWHHYTHMCGHPVVAQRCFDFIKWNLELIAQRPDFGNLEPDTLVQILKQDDLVVHDEMKLFEYVANWINHQALAMISEAGYTVDEDGWDIEKLNSEDHEILSQLEPLLHYVMAHIRFPMMSPNQLARLLLVPIVQKYNEYFMKRMGIGMSYHSDVKDAIENACVREGGISLFTPRLYTAENWSMLLPVDHTSLPPYQSRTHVFSSNVSFADHRQGDKTCEWAVDIYPKGVCFQKFYQIGCLRMEIVPEVVLNKVRVSITCKEPPKYSYIRVKVGILVRGVVDGVEHVMHTMARIHRFDHEEKILNLDDIISYDKLNINSTHDTFTSSPAASPTENNSSLPTAPFSPYLVGPSRDTLKIHVVIAPMDQVCSPRLLLKRKI